MKPLRDLVLATVAGALAVSCSYGSGDSAKPSAQAGDASTHVHSDDHHHGEHAAPEALQRMVLTERDLPEGYVSGAGHRHVTTSGPAPALSPGCAVLAELIGDHPAVHQTVHPEARASFSRSHFGPQITATLVDFGDEGLAAMAVERVERAAEDCSTYVQAVSGPGARSYRVAEGTTVLGLEPGAHVTLSARGADFDGISWEVWAGEAEGRLVAVALRTAPGGDAGDLPAAVRAALDRAQHAGQ